MKIHTGLLVNVVLGGDAVGGVNGTVRQCAIVGSSIRGLLSWFTSRRGASSLAQRVVRTERDAECTRIMQRLVCLFP